MGCDMFELSCHFGVILMGNAIHDLITGNDLFLIIDLARELDSHGVHSQIQVEVLELFKNLGMKMLAIFLFGHHESLSCQI